MLAMGSRAYEASGAGVMAERGKGSKEPEAEARCEEAFQWYRAVADRSARAIQESGGSDAETEQVRVGQAAGGDPRAARPARAPRSPSEGSGARVEQTRGVVG